MTRLVVAIGAALFVACASPSATPVDQQPVARPVCDRDDPCDGVCGLQSDGCGGTTSCTCADGTRCGGSVCVSDAAYDDAGAPIDALVCTDALDDECVARCLRRSGIACRAALVFEVRKALRRAPRADVDEVCALAVAPRTEAGAARFMALWRALVEARIADVGMRVAVVDDLVRRDCGGGVAPACREARRFDRPADEPFYSWPVHRAVVADACVSPTAP